MPEAPTTTNDDAATTHTSPMAALPEMWRVPLEQGWSIFPLQPEGKRPLGDWKDYQSQKAPAGDVALWASSPAKLNAGIVTGAISGLVVLDLDSQAALDEAVRRGLPTVTVSTKTPGGWHLYFKHPGGSIGNRAGIFKGADIRGDRGYVVAPGSTFVPTEKELADGKVPGPYVWLDGCAPEECALADLPPWLAAMLVKAEPSATTQPSEPRPTAATAPTPAPPPAANQDQREKARASSALVSELERVRSAEEGERNHTLNAASFNLGQLHTHLPAEQTKARLWEAAQLAGMEAEEIGPTIESGWNSGMANPRGPMPERPKDGAGDASRAGTSGNDPTPDRQAALIMAKPYVWRKPASIPTRPWVYGQELLRGSLSAIAAPGGLGKSTLIIGHGLAMATGRKLLHQQVWNGPKRVWYWNLEDSNEELARSIQAACLHWKITPADLEGRLFLNTSLDGDDLCITTQEGNWIRIAKPITDRLVEQIKANSIDVLIIDPFVGCHTASENDNMAMDKVAKEWAQVATQAKCAVLIVHHTKKLEEGRTATADSLRGASAVVNAARSVVVLNPASKDEAGKIGVNDNDIRDYFRADDGKANRARKGGSKWYRRIGVYLGNGFGGMGDEMAVIVPHTPPDPFDDVTLTHLAAIQLRIEQAEECDRRADSKAGGWVGLIVANVLGYGDLAKDQTDDDDQAREKVNLRNRIKTLVRTWTANGMLVQYEGKDKNRKSVPFIRVGRDQSAPVEKTGAVRAGALEQ